MIFIMGVIFLLDIAIITTFIRRLRNFRKCLKAQKDFGYKKSKKTHKKTKSKKGKKSLRKVEEEKLSVEHVSDIETSVANYGDSQQDANDSIESAESDIGLVKKTVVTEAQQVPSQSLSKDSPFQMSSAYPQTVMIEGKSYYMVKTSDLQNFQKIQPQMMHPAQKQFQF